MDSEEQEKFVPETYAPPRDVSTSKRKIIIGIIVTAVAFVTAGTVVAVTTMLMKPEQPIPIQDEHPNCEMGKKYNFEDNKCEDPCPTGFDYVVPEGKNSDQGSCESIDYDPFAQEWITDERLWENNIIFYTYDHEDMIVQYTQDEKRKVRIAMDTILLNLEPGCIDFAWKKERNQEDKNHILFKKKDGSLCKSEVGKDQDGENEIYLGTDCFENQGIVLHEVLHSLGAYHQMNRPDRWLFLDVSKENTRHIQQQFTIRNVSLYDMSIMVPFDFYSIMMYTETSGGEKKDNHGNRKTCMKVNDKYRDDFTKDGVPPLTEEYQEMSPVDIVAISKKYQCSILPEVKRDYMEYTLKMLEVMERNCPCRDTDISTYDKDDCSYDCETIRFEIHAILTDLEWEMTDVFNGNANADLREKYCEIYKKCEGMKVDDKKNLQTWFSQTRIVEKGNKFESLECQKINKVKFD